MKMLRGIAWGVVAVTVIVSGVATFTNPDMTPSRLVLTFWPNFVAALVAVVVLAFTERRGML